MTRSSIQRAGVSVDPIVECGGVCGNTWNLMSQIRNEVWQAVHGMRKQLMHVLHAGSLPSAVT